MLRHSPLRGTTRRGPPQVKRQETSNDWWSTRREFPRSGLFFLVFIFLRSGSFTKDKRIEELTIRTVKDKRQEEKEMWDREASELRSPHISSHSEASTRNR